MEVHAGAVKCNAVRNFAGPLQVKAVAFGVIRRYPTDIVYEAAVNQRVGGCGRCIKAAANGVVDDEIDKIEIGGINRNTRFEIRQVGRLKANAGLGAHPARLTAVKFKISKDDIADTVPEI